MSYQFSYQVLDAITNTVSSKFPSRDVVVRRVARKAHELSDRLVLEGDVLNKVRSVCQEVCATVSEDGQALGEREQKIKSAAHTKGKGSEKHSSLTVGETVKLRGEVGDWRFWLIDLDLQVRKLTKRFPGLSIKLDITEAIGKPLVELVQGMSASEGLEIAQTATGLVTGAAQG